MMKREFPRLIFSSVLLLCLIVNARPMQSQGNSEVGIPWNGEPGIRELVKDIQVRPGDIKKGPVVHRRARANRENLPQDPNSPQVTKPLAPAASPKGDFSSLDSLSADIPLQFNVAQSGGTSFIGANLGMSGFVPPDAMGAVGPTQILVVVNGRIRTFTRDGFPDFAIDTTTDSFFNSVRNSSSTTDPRVVFGRLQQRWFIVMINTSTPNRVLIAVSTAESTMSGRNPSIRSSDSAGRPKRG